MTILSANKSDSNPFTQFMSSVSLLWESNFDSQIFLKPSNSNKRVRARILPKQIRSSYIFASESLSWLQSCAINISSTGETITYTIPLLGITNRPLAGYKQAGLNLFKTLVKITPKVDLNNLDQCTIEFGLRLPITANEFIEEIQRQIYLSTPRIKTKGKLTFYSHAVCNVPVTTDLEALRLSISKTMPVINIDWLDPSMTWESFWNPCSQLEPIKLKLENKLCAFIDLVIQTVCASQCNAIIQKRDCFFDSTYLPYRKKQMLPELNKIFYTPESYIQNNRILDLFKAEKNLLSYTNQKPSKQLHAKAKEEEGWLLANI